MPNVSAAHRLRHYCGYLVGDRQTMTAERLRSHGCGTIVACGHLGCVQPQRPVLRSPGLRHHYGKIGFTLKAATGYGVSAAHGCGTIAARLRTCHP